MFGFGEVRTHLGVVFRDAFGLIKGFLVRFLKKWKKASKFGKCRGAKLPRSSVGPHQGVARPHRGMVEKEIWPALGTPQCSNATLQRRPTPQRSHCSQHGNVCVLFRCAFPLF